MTPPTPRRSSRRAASLRVMAVMIVSFADRFRRHRVVDRWAERRNTIHPSDLAHPRPGLPACRCRGHPRTVLLDVDGTLRRRRGGDRADARPPSDLVDNDPVDGTSIRQSARSSATFLNGTLDL